MRSMEQLGWRTPMLHGRDNVLPHRVAGIKGSCFIARSRERDSRNARFVGNAKRQLSDWDYTLLLMKLDITLIICDA